MADWTTNAQVSTLKRLLDATHSAYYLLTHYTGTSADNIVHYNDTENVADMTGMFWDNRNLINSPNLNTSNVTNMKDMFNGCRQLETLPLYDTSNVTNMQNMFMNCALLTVIPAYNATIVTNFSYTFGGCSNLEEIHMYGMKVNFSINASTKFTREALVEIIGNLAEVVATHTLTMGATNSAKLTEDDIAVANAKGWTIA